MSSIVVVGGANTDVRAATRRLPSAGVPVRADRADVGVGGKGVNQAVAAARLGARVTLVGCVGDDERGRAVRELLTREGVDVTYLSSAGEVPTGLLMEVVDDDHRRLTTFTPGANAHLSAVHVQAAAGAIATADAVLVQLEVPLEAARTAVFLARAAGARVILDAAPAQLLREDVLSQLHVLHANAAEAEVLTGVRVEDHADARRAAENLLRRGVAAAAVGAPDGNVLVTAEQALFLPHLAASVVDDCGAGDAFTAALGVALAERRDWREAGALASGATALATQRFGALPSLPRREAVLELLAGRHTIVAAG